MQETDQVQMTLICRGNPKGPTGMFCRTVHNGAVQRVKHLSTPIIMARMLDAVSGSAESCSTSEQRMEEHNPQQYRLASGAGPASCTLMVAFCDSDAALALVRGRRPNWAHRVARRRVQSQPRAARRIRHGWRAYASRARALVDVAGPTYGGGSGGHGYAAEVSLEGSLRVRIAALRCFACSFEVVARILLVGAVTVAPSLGI